MSDNAASTYEIKDEKPSSSTQAVTGLFDVAVLAEL